VFDAQGMAHIVGSEDSVLIPADTDYSMEAVHANVVEMRIR
jgi:hypothetical protein